jgi:hypothetical protein
VINEYGEPRRARLSWAGKLLAFVLACLIFASAIFLIFQLSSLISPRHRKALKEEQAREEAFLRSLDYYVVDSGYVTKSSGLNEIYVPTVQVYVANASDRIIKDLWLTANFEREGKFLCRANRLIVDLNPGENREVGLSCSEAMFVGTVFTGLSLAQTTEDLTYFIWARSNKATVTLLKDVLKFKIIQSRAPY